jgi:protein MAK11
MTIVVWRTKDWMALRTLKGHKAKIAALAVHPSGKLALSSDTTGILHIWDLTTAKLAFKHRTKESSVVRWSPDGQAFASIHGDTAEISATSAELLSSCTSKGKLYDVRFIDDNTVVTAGEEKIIGGSTPLP